MALEYMLRRAEGHVGRRDQIINMVVDRMKASQMYYQGVLNRLPRLYDLWRGVYTGRFHPHKNNAHIPMIFSMIWSDAARKVATSLNAWPILYFTGYGPDDASTARKREALISAQMKDMDLFVKEVDNFVTADLYGTATSAVMWDHTEELRIVESVESLPLSGARIRQIKKENVVTFDGPNTESVDRLDLFPPPATGRRKMQWIIRRYYLDIDDVRFMVSQGVFDKAELDRLLREGGGGADEAQGDLTVQRFMVRSGMTPEQARFMDKYSRPIEMLEFWGKCPSELADDGATQRVITVANRRYLMRNRPNPFWHGRLPFLTYAPMPDPHYFDAPGKAEVAEKLQIVSNRYINQQLDATDLIIDPMWFYDRNRGLNTRNLYSRPGKFVGVDGPPSTVVYPLQHNLANIQIGAQQVQMMREYAQMGTGIVDDAVSGLPGPDRQTAREFVGRREAAGTRLMLESRIYEETYLEPLGNMMAALDKQFLETPKEILILGDNAQVDPVSGLPIPVSREVLQGFDLTPNYAARAMGATSSLSRSVKQQNLMQLLQVITTAPQMMGAINMVNFLRQTMRELELNNINELINQQPAMQPIMEAAGAMGAEGVPTSGAMANGAIPAMPLQPQGEGMPSDIAGMLAPQGGIA